MKRANFPDRKEQRRKEAEARAETRAARSDSEQRRILIEERRGHSTKETERLERRLEGRKK